jgi:hypothetical protein
MYFEILLFTLIIITIILIISLVYNNYANVNENNNNNNKIFYELEKVKGAGKFAVWLENRLIEEIEKNVDEGIKETHESISKTIEDAWQKGDSKKII